MTELIKRRIDVTINLGKGDYGEQRGDDMTLTGYKVAAQVVYLNGAFQATATLRVYGLPLAMINLLTGTGINAYEWRKNSVTIAVGDEGSPAMATLYQGNIVRAYGEFNGQPDVCLVIQAQGAVESAVKPVNARSYVGPTDTATVIEEIAKSMGLVFENNGVSVMLASPYFHGTDWEQLKACANAANILFTVDRGVLAIWPKGSPREQQNIILVSPETGMVGYPNFSSQGIVVTTILNSDIALGKNIHIDSSVTPASGKWNVFGVVHMAESETPNGAWFTQVMAQRIEQ